MFWLNLVVTPESPVADNDDAVWDPPIPLEPAPWVWAVSLLKV
jgi:hypothetical protein